MRTTKTPGLNGHGRSHVIDASIARHTFNLRIDHKFVRVNTYVYFVLNYNIRTFILSEFTEPNQSQGERTAVARRCSPAGLTNRADRVWLIKEPNLKNFAASEMEILSDFILAKLREYRATAQLEVLKTEQERALKEQRTK
jgi:hypothetical protein